MIVCFSSHILNSICNYIPCLLSCIRLNCGVDPVSSSAVNNVGYTFKYPEEHAKIPAKVN